ncbi:MAG: PASTA domain-containing protein [Prevotella sp.]|nr:PASTA domain-containing protein [Prevotella sp.]
MKAREFFDKFRSKRLWLNLLAMLLVVVLLCVGTYIAIAYYTHHGEEINIPDIRHKQFSDAEHILESNSLNIMVSDTGYVRTLPADCILEQSPEPGRKVKSGRTIYVVINSANSPMLTIPDIIDNCSYREARAKLTAMGFKVGPTEYIPGEKDWLYGLKHNGVLLQKGSKVSVDDMIVMQVGDGLMDENDTIMYMDADDFMPASSEDGYNSSGQDDEDDFEVVTGP